MKSWVGLVVAAVLLLSAAPAAAEQVDQARAVEDFLVERMRAIGTPGLSYALVRDGRVVAARAWGVDGHGRPLTVRTPMGFGSVAKPVTATAVLRLVDAGAVALDDPVTRHLPWFRLADPAHTERITVRHLLEQTSGISARDGYARSDLGDNAPHAIRRWVAGLADVTPTAAPGERHQYSPANATVLAAMAEEITGLSFADVVRREVFAPLDMADGVADTEDAERMPPGHEYYFGAVRPADRAFDTSGLAYGYLAGSVTDLAHLAIPLVDGGRHGRTRFLAEDTVAALLRGGPRATCGSYPLGWRRCTPAGADTPVLWHAGAVPGYHSAVLAAPRAGWAVAVQQNVYSPLRDGALTSVAFGALAIALGGAPGPSPADSTETVALVGLGALAVVLAGGLGWSIRRLLGRGRAGDRAWRMWLAAAGWGGLGVLSALAAGLLLPGMFDLRLRHVLLFMPDLGQLAVAIVVLGSALAGTRLVILLVHARAGRRERS